MNTKRVRVTLTIKQGESWMKADFTQGVPANWSLEDCAREFSQMVKAMTEKMPTFRKPQ